MTHTGTVYRWTSGLCEKTVPVFQLIIFRRVTTGEGTARLIGLFQSHPAVMKVYFNDLTIPGVLPLKHHDNHFHVAVRAGTK